MKKFLFLVLLLPFCIGKVLASEVYYSSYTPFSDWQEQSVSASDTCHVEEETRYLWYQIHPIPGNYALFQNGGLFLNDCYDTALSSWSTSVPEHHESRNILERTKYTYKLDTGIRYIHLTNVSGSYYSFRIPELRTMVNGNDIAYTYTCVGCNDTFDGHIHNGNRYENWSSLTNGGSLTIDLGAIYPAHKVELQFYIYDVGTDPKNYTVSFSKDGSNMIASQSYTLYFSGMEYEQSEYRIHNIYNMGVDESVWTTTDITYTPYTNEFQLSTNTQKEYAYTEKMCRTYTESREYSTEYSKSEIENFPHQDVNQGKKYYRYQTREKLELADIDTIDKRKSNWDDMVLYSSQPYEVIETIDWSQNGIYPVIFQVGNLHVTREVEVKLVENQLAEYEKQIAELQKEYQQSQMNWEEQKSHYEQQIEKLEKEVNSLKEQLKNCEENCQNDKACLQDTINQNNQLLKQYEQRVLELSNLLNEYQLKLAEQKQSFEELQIMMQVLQSQLNELKKDNEELSKVIEKQESKLEEYKQNVSQLADDNEYYQQVLKDKQLELIQMEKSNLEYLDNIEKLKEKLDIIIQEKEKEISTVEQKYQQQLDKKEQLIDAYRSKIEQLSKQLELVHKQVGQVMAEYNQTNTENIDLKKAVEALQQENDVLQAEVAVKKNETIEDQTIPQDSLHQKLNNYVLKIHGENKINLCWFYIICLSVGIGVLIHKMRKKSNIK